MPGNLCFDSTRAASITAAVPEPSSFAPGASDVAFIASVTRLSMCPGMITTSFGRSVPRWMAIMSQTRVGVGTRFAGKHVARSDRSAVAEAADSLELARVQSSAAPMPRFGSVCEESVCRVPKLTSFSTVRFI